MKPLPVMIALIAASVLAGGSGILAEDKNLKRWTVETSSGTLTLESPLGPNAPAPGQQWQYHALKTKEAPAGKVERAAKPARERRQPVADSPPAPVAPAAADDNSDREPAGLGRLFGRSSRETDESEEKPPAAAPRARVERLAPTAEVERVAAVPDEAEAGSKSGVLDRFLNRRINPSAAEPVEVAETRIPTEKPAARAAAPEEVETGSKSGGLDRFLNHRLKPGPEPIEMAETPVPTVAPVEAAPVEAAPVEAAPVEVAAPRVEKPRRSLLASLVGSQPADVAPAETPAAAEPIAAPAAEPPKAASDENGRVLIAEIGDFPSEEKVEHRSEGGVFGKLFGSKPAPKPASPAETAPVEVEAVTVASASRAPEPPAPAPAAVIEPAGDLPKWENEPESKGLLGRILASNGKKEPEAAATTADLFPKSEDRPDGVGVDRKVREEVEQLMGDISTDFVARVQSFDDPELRIGAKDVVEGDLETVWADKVTSSLWDDQKPVRRTLAEAYALSLQHSKQVRSLGRVPLIYEASADERLITFGAEFFAQGDYDHTDEPTGSTLTTGQTGRFRQDNLSSETGVSKTFWNGAQARLSNRLSTLDNNSEFLVPNPQTGSEAVFALTVPVMRGAGRENALATFRVAKLESDVAAVAFLKQLQDHLGQVNQAYWTLYLARAAYRQRVQLVERTSGIVTNLEKRQEIDPDATKSELFRAKAAMKKREADVQRTRMSVRVAEEQLRALVNDPDLPMGASGEWIPTSSPQIEPPRHNIGPISLAALANRSEILQGVLAVEAATIERNRAGNGLKPQLDLIAEVGFSGIDGGRDVDGSYDDMFNHGTDVRAGFRFSQVLERSFARASVTRRDLEYLQRVDELNLVTDRVLLDTLVRYREMLSAYRDMHAKYQTLLASREELSDLERRTKLDPADDGAKTVAYYLQLTLDALERNQVAEEEFLVGVVNYNVALADLEQAKGTFLQYQDVSILRQESKTRGGVDELIIRKN